MHSSKIILALAFLSAAVAAPMPQLHGEGAALDALFTSTDNGIGYSTENIENAVANIIKPGSAPTGNTGAGSDNSGTGGSGSPPPPPPRKRQLDKVAAGLQNVAGAVGVGATTEATTDQLKSVDGTLTDGAANAGLVVGNTEANTLEGVTAGL
jgi:hypothetical protein